MKETEKLLGFHKANTSAYHPQTDGFVERFNRTLTTMLAKTVESSGKDWDRQLPFVLFAYRASQQQSTMESPFYLLYGRDPRLPFEARCPTPGNWHDSVSGKHRSARRPSMTRGADRPSSGLETVLSCLSRQPRLGRHASLQGLSMDPIVFWS